MQPEAAALAERGPSRLGTVTPALSQVLAQADSAAAEPIYLFAACTSAWARAQGFTPLIDERDELRQLLSRVAQLAPDLDEAGAERELGKLYAALPAYAGGDLQLARSHFEAAVARAPDSARTRIAFARSVAVKAQDRALFLAQLQAAASSSDASAAAEARDLLARENELFGPAEAAQPIPGGPTH
ncbi:MAG TPA: TRAP transporter TatT component family protein [Myxococcales bacterium]|nr:TRAP transporter TatT component family protein [Myxococcales bacterium]